ncbi:MAG: Mov34/MPN/PAD-1 family protein [Campylobacteraceae bacterium]
MLKITKAVLEEIIKHAKDDLPNEACGYLAGVNGEIKKAFKMTNVDASPTHFSFDPKEQFEAFKKAKGEDLRLIACYHSHPNTPARASDEDIKLAYDSNISYIIISLAKSEPVVKSFKIKNGEAQEEILEII